MDHQLKSLTARIVSAHVTANAMSSEQLPALIRQVHQALTSADKAPIEPIRSEPAVTAKKSIFADHLVCMDCGKSFKMLRRHLTTDHDMTPYQYRSKWNLPASYPMVTADYAATRSQLAKDSGLGRNAKTQPVPKKRGHAKKG